MIYIVAFLSAGLVGVGVLSAYQQRKIRLLQLGMAGEAMNAGNRRRPPGAEDETPIIRNRPSTSSAAINIPNDNAEENSALLQSVSLTTEAGSPTTAAAMGAAAGSGAGVANPHLDDQAKAAVLALQDAGQDEFNAAMDGIPLDLMQ